MQAQPEPMLAEGTEDYLRQIEERHRTTPLDRPAGEAPAVENPRDEAEGPGNPDGEPGEPGGEMPGGEGDAGPEVGPDGDDSRAGAAAVSMFHRRRLPAIRGRSLPAASTRS